MDVREEVIKGKVGKVGLTRCDVHWEARLWVRESLGASVDVISLVKGLQTVGLPSLGQPFQIYPVNV